MSTDSIFTKIIKGEIPCYKLFEDEHVIAFLDINPIQLGHCLIVPKIQHDHFIDVPEPYYSKVFAISKTLAQALHKATSCVRVGAVIAGWEVPHFHYHLVPMWDEGDLSFKKAKPRSESELQDIQNKILKELN